MVSLPGGQLCWEMKVEKKNGKKEKKRGKTKALRRATGGGGGEEIMLPLPLLLYPPRPPTPTRSPRAEMMYGCKGHMLAA